MAFPPCGQALEPRQSVEDPRLAFSGNECLHHGRQQRLPQRPALSLCGSSLGNGIPPDRLGMHTSDMALNGPSGVPIHSVLCSEHFHPMPLHCRLQNARSVLSSASPHRNNRPDANEGRIRVALRGSILSQRVLPPTRLLLKGDAPPLAEARSCCPAFGRRMAAACPANGRGVAGHWPMDCPRNVRLNFRPIAAECPQSFHRLAGRRPGNGRVESQPWPRSCQGNVPTISRHCPRTCQGIAPPTSWSFSHPIPGLCRTLSRQIPSGGSVGSAAGPQLSSRTRHDSTPQSRNRGSVPPRPA
jgi:hypothetical protein